METKNVNLKDVLKLPETDFKKYFQEWLDNDGVARALQAKLRKDLFDNFNKTYLGRKMSYQNVKSNRMLLSPLILALNTLVAEFLYAQSCHFSLSVFCTEVPYRNTMPDFENSEYFRFTKEEIIEIFDAINAFNETDRMTIIRNYSRNKQTSLLHLILAEQSKFTRNEVKLSDTKTPPVVPVEENKEKMKARNDKPAERKEQPLSHTKKKTKDKVRKEHVDEDQDEDFSKSEEESYAYNLNRKRHQSNERDSTNKNAFFYTHHFRYLNQYLTILSKKVNEMATSLEKLEKEKKSTSNEKKSLTYRKYESINRSLEKVLENLKNLTLSKRRTRNFAVIIKAIDNMTKQFEKCASNFDQATKTLNTSSNKPEVQANNNHSDESPQEKPYSDWLTELKNTKYGKRFINKVEMSLLKALEYEKKNMTLDYEKRLENERNLMKIKYKQKLLQRLGRSSSKEEEMTKTSTKNEFIETALKDLLAKHEELLQKLNENREVLQSLPVNSNENLNVKELVKMLPTEIFPLEIQKAEDEQNEPKQKLREDVEKVFRTIAEHGKNVDKIINDTKLRVQELEKESNKLDRNFQEFLEIQEKRQVIPSRKSEFIVENTKESKNTQTYKLNSLKTTSENNENFNKLNSSRSEILSQDIRKDDCDCPNAVIHTSKGTLIDRSISARSLKEQRNNGKSVNSVGTEISPQRLQKEDKGVNAPEEHSDPIYVPKIKLVDRPSSARNFKSHSMGTAVSPQKFQKEDKSINTQDEYLASRKELAERSVSARSYKQPMSINILNSVGTEISPQRLQNGDKNFNVHTNETFYTTKNDFADKSTSARSNKQPKILHLSKGLFGDDNLESNVSENSRNKIGTSLKYTVTDSDENVENEEISMNKDDKKCFENNENLNAVEASDRFSSLKSRRSQFSESRKIEETTTTDEKINPENISDNQIKSTNSEINLNIVSNTQHNIETNLNLNNVDSSENIKTSDKLLEEITNINNIIERDIKFDNLPMTSLDIFATEVLESSFSSSISLNISIGRNNHSDSDSWN